MGKLDGRVAIVTGGSRGQGAAEGRLFTAEGATVYLTDVLVDEGKRTAEDIGATFLEHDVTDAERWIAVVEQVVAEQGRVDVLVNNAGIFVVAAMTETSLELWHRVVAVNQTGVMLGMQAVAGPMKAQGSGSIVNISSVAGLMGTATSFAYGATKWAVRGMTKSAAQELGPHGIRVNSIHPGIIDTEMLAGVPLDEISKAFPLPRAGTADDIARAALWLASDDSAYATGAELVIDGGMRV